NAPTVAGELAIARGAAAIASGRARAVLAGGVDQIDPFLGSMLTDLGAGEERRGEGAVVLVLGCASLARGRGGWVPGGRRGGEAGSAARASCRPSLVHGVGRGGSQVALIIGR